MFILRVVLLHNLKRLVKRDAQSADLKDIVVYVQSELQEKSNTSVRTGNVLKIDINLNTNVTQNEREYSYVYKIQCVKNVPKAYAVDSSSA